jgi:hypothetical protein
MITPKNKEKFESQIIDFLMQQCPFKIPEGEKELAKDILYETVLGTKTPKKRGQNTMSKPCKLNDKIYCQQYACLNNTGLERGKIHYGIGGICTLENPGITDFGNGVWGCEDERYGNEIKIKKEPTP